MLSSSTRGDCSDTTEEMTVDSRDSKDLTAQELGEEKQLQQQQQQQQHQEEQAQEEDPMNVPMDLQDNNNNSDADADGDADADDAGSEQPEETQDLGETEMEQQQMEEEEQGESPNSPSTPPRSPTPPATLVPKLEQPATPPSESPSPSPSPTPTPTPTPTVTPTPRLPKLRLNALLASDPALKPDAKELHLSEKPRLLAPPPHIKPEPQAQPQSNLQPDLVEPLLKPARFMCLPCGIAFSSPSTLEAHQAYYCSHRIKDTEDADGLSTDKAGGADKSSAGGGVSSGVGGTGSSGSEPPAKVARIGKQYACTQCSYSADKKVSLNRHMRMHQTSPAPSLGSLGVSLGSLPSLTANGVPGSAGGSGGSSSALEEGSSQQQTDRYCSDCDIRFNNIKTYRAHKQHYCSSRRSDGRLTPKGGAPAAAEGAAAAAAAAREASGSGSASAGAVGAAAAPGKLSPQTRNKTPTPAMVAAAAAASLQAPTPQPFLALPTHPIIIVPCSLIRAASIIPGPLPTPASGIVNLESTCFTVDNGAIKPLATALISNALAGNMNHFVNSLHLPALEPDRAAAERSAAAEAGGVLEPKSSSPPEPKRKEAGGSRESAPLDLSFRRSPISILQHRQRHIRSAAAAAAAALLDVEEVLLGAGKENVESAIGGRAGGSVTPEQIVCAPSLPSSPSMSPSPKRRASPRSSGAGSASSMSPPGLNPHLLDIRSMLPADFGLSESLLAKTNPELALKLAAAAAAAVAAGGSGASAVTAAPANSGSQQQQQQQQPQIYVKQGVSKCKECNIVFCKYENYLAHKQHYCSARNQEPVGEGNDSKSAVSPSNVTAGNGGGGVGASSVETTPVAYQQLICAACGIKYTSLDNLRAHQNYYCPKGGATAATAPAEATKEKCGKCKTLHEHGHPCPAPPAATPLTAPSSAGVGGGLNSVNKCPVCGVVSPTAALARKHMEMHGTVKAFRCSICQYKGNTLRGMRTHIRTHFDKKTSDVNEEHYMTCIFEEDNSGHAAVSQEMPPTVAAAVAAAAATAVPQQEPPMEHPPQLFNCDYCNYASTYKGNVLRHMKLLHPHVAINSPSISPESREQETLLPSATPNPHEASNGEAISFHIKSEPGLDNPPTLGPLVHENNNSPIGTPLPHIKAEPMDMGLDAMSPTSLALPLPPPVASPLAAAAAEAMKKYCSVCDISFNYVKTFLAHKQFYCKSKPPRPEVNDSPSPNANHLAGVGVGVGMGMGMGGQPLQSPSELMLMQKNKENLQEAAI